MRFESDIMNGMRRTIDYQFNYLSDKTLVICFSTGSSFESYFVIRIHQFYLDHDPSIYTLRHCLLKQTKRI
jgi:hypothetical protein